MFETIRHIKDKNLKRQYIKFIIKNNNKKHFSIYNNNDTFDILLSFIFHLKYLIFSIYNSFIHYIQFFHLFIFRFHFLVLLIFMFFTFTLTLNNNSRIPTKLILSAYFPNKEINRITYDKILEKEKENKKTKVLKMNYDEYQKLYNALKANKSIDGMPCENCFQSKHENRNCENNMNINKINDDSSLKDFFAKIKKNKSKADNFNSPAFSKKMGYLIFHNETFITYLVLIFSSSCFYFFIKYTIYSKIKDSFIFNVVCISITFNILYILYRLEFFFSSNFFFIIIMYNNKCLIESVYINLKYQRKDFEIFSTSLIAFNFLQFCLKTIILLNLTIISGILSIFFFRTWINYILFYICLFTLIVFFANCLESITPYIFKPIKNLIIFFLGIFNLLFSKLLLNIFINKISFLRNIFMDILDKKEKVDCLYLISDLFTIFCFGYIRGYLEFQIEGLLLIDELTDNKELRDLSDLKELKEERDKFLFKKNLILEKIIIWPTMYILSFLFCLLEIFIKEKVCLFMSIYLVKILITYHSNIFNIKNSKFLFSAFSAIFLVFNIEFSCCEENIYIINLLYSYTSIDKSFIRIALKIFISLVIYYFIITINFNIAMVIEEKNKLENSSIMKRIQSEAFDEIINSSKLEKKEYKIISTIFNFSSIASDLILNHFLICLLIAIYQYYEDSFVIKLINALTIAIICITKIIYLKDITNNYYYYFSNYIWLMISLRLIFLCRNEFSIILCICHTNLQVFIYYFYINRKNSAFLNALFLLTVIIRCWQIYSLFLVTNTIFIILLVTINFINNNIKYLNEEDNKKNGDQKDNNENFGIVNIYLSLSFVFLVPITIFFIIYLKFPKYHFLLNYLDKFIKDLIVVIKEYYENFRAKEHFDWIDSFEFNFIDQMINFIERIRTSLEN